MGLESWRSCVLQDLGPFQTAPRAQALQSRAVSMLHQLQATGITRCCGKDVAHNCIVTTMAFVLLLPQATDSASGTSLFPNGSTEGEAQYEGTVVQIAAAEEAGKGPQIPVLYW